MTTVTTTVAAAVVVVARYCPVWRRGLIVAQSAQGLQRHLSTCARPRLSLHCTRTHVRVRVKSCVRCWQRQRRCCPSVSIILCPCPPHLDCAACHPQQSSLPCLPALMRACCRRLHCAKSPSSITQAASQTQQRGICHGHGAVYYVRIHTPHGKATATQRVQRLNAAASRDS